MKKTSCLTLVLLLAALTIRAEIVSITVNLTHHIILVHQNIGGLDTVTRLTNEVDFAACTNALLPAITNSVVEIKVPLHQ